MERVPQGHATSEYQHLLGSRISASGNTAGSGSVFFSYNSLEEPEHSLSLREGDGAPSRLQVPGGTRESRRLLFVDVDEPVKVLDVMLLNPAWATIDDDMLACTVDRPDGQ